MGRMSSDRQHGKHDRHGLEPKKTSSKSINPLVVVHRCHSDRTRYKFDISLAKRDIKGYQLNQT